jgi:tetratricopeptide (TPR) repeat protein
MTWALVWSLMANNRPGEARQVAEGVASAFMRLEIPWYDGWVTSSEILHLLQDHERELELAREGLDRLPENLFLLECEGRALAALGRSSEVRSRAAVIASRPSPPGISPGSVLETLAGELRAHGDRSASLAVVDAALAWHGGQPAAFRAAAGGQLLLGRLLYLGERWAEAESVFESLAADTASMVVALGYLGSIAARSGDREEATRWSEELERVQMPYLRGVNTRGRARIAALLGDRDEAVQLLRRAFSEGVGYGLWLHTDMDLESLRGYAPYQELVKPKG